jgi:hypothetical protein
MSLLVPPEIIKQINPNSGFINLKSEFGGKTTKGLFLTDVNRNYLLNQLYSLLTNQEFVQDTIGSIDATLVHDTLRTGAKQSMDLVRQFKPAKPILAERIQVLIEAWKLPYREDHAIRNPVQELSLINREFLTTSAAAIIQSPDCILTNYYDYDPNTGKQDVPEWDYGASSWSDGTWHPEHLFTQSRRNRSNPYWVPVNITFDTNPPIGDDYATYGSRSTSFHPRAVHYNPSRADISQPTARQSHVDTGLPIGQERLTANRERLTANRERLTANRERLAPKREKFVPSTDDDWVSVDRPSIEPAYRVDPGYVDTPNIQDLLEEQSYPYMGGDEFSQTYHIQNTKYAGGPGPGNRYRYDFYGKGGFSNGGIVPPWQSTVNDRPYQRNNTEGLREGGSSDRRVQRPSGYDMTALIVKSSY